MALTINQLPLGAGTLGICPMPGRDGRYQADLAEIALWAPALVLTMNSDAELARKGAEGLGADLAARGIPWVQLPVQDFGVPDQAVEAAWPAVSAKARGLLAEGRRVLIHCMGGCGRSGTALLRLMVEAGEDPLAALTRLRQVRPCAVEKPEQFDWAAQGAARP